MSNFLNYHFGVFKNKQNIMKNKSINLFITLIILLFVNGCKDMDSTYLRYIEDGEIVYVNKADSLKAFPGKERVLLSWRKSIDNKASRAMIYWNNGEDSLEHYIDRTSSNNTVEVIVPNLPEGNYSFDVYTFDEKGNKSIRSNVQGTTFGDYYQNKLNNRTIENSYYGEIYWHDSPTESCCVEISYNDINGSSQVIMVPYSVSYTFIENSYPLESEIKYRTAYIPEGISIDTFYTDYKTYIIDNLVNRTKFSRWNNDYFPYKQNSTYNIEKMWDGISSATFGYIWDDPVLPSSITFDLGQSIKLKGGRIFPNHHKNYLYAYGNVKKFQLWGSDVETGTLDYATWSYLGEFNSIRPSGLPDSVAPTAEDIAYASQGEYFELDLDAPKVRYLRLVVLDVYEGKTSYKPKINITELMFWGDDRKMF